MPASSKMAKAESISARSSGIACLRMEKITVLEPLQPEKEVRISGSHVEAGWEGLLWERLHAEQEKAERNSPHEEKAVAETICDELSTTPILHPSVSLGRRGREFQSEVEPRKKGGVR